MARLAPSFQNRRDAGRQLARALLPYAADRPLVLALPRGGVPVAAEVAQALKAELDLVFVRKLGAPGYPEFGIGAIVDGANPQLVLNDEIVRQLQPGEAYIRDEIRRQLSEIDRRRQLYMGDALPIPVTDRTVIVVDDGIATGGTVRAALKALRSAGAGRIVLAVPVAPRDIIAELRHQCDDLVCLSQPEPFHAVGAHYLDFDQTSDAEVVHLMQRARTA